MAASATMPEKAAGETRARIMAAAREAFAECGYSGASVSMIARRAGIRIGSLYWAFASKEALFAAVLTEAAEDWRARVFRPQSAPVGLDSFRKDIMGVAAGFSEAPEFLRLLMVVATEHQAGAAEILAAATKIRQDWRSAIETRLIASLPEIDLPRARDLARRISRLTLQLLDGVFMSLQFEQAELGPHDLIAEVADLVHGEVERGVAARRPGRT